MIKTELIEQFARDYMGRVYYFCLRRTGDEHDAEDLASDIAYNVIASLRRGVEPDNFHAYVWSIARRRYGAWVKSRRALNGDAVRSLDDADDIMDDSVDVEGEVVRCDEIMRLRRELSLLSADYREIVVAYYIENRRTREIASSLGIPKSTVESRLARARTMLTEGMKMAREFGKRSYDPSRIVYTQNRDTKTGEGGEKFIERSLSQNILLEAYDSPSTAEELSVELGVALPYMEEELRFLCGGDMLECVGKRYRTNIVILSKEAQSDVYDDAKVAVSKALPLIKRAIEHIGQKRELPKNQSYDDMKPALLEMYVSRIPIKPACEIHTLHHKVGGDWAILGCEVSDLPKTWLEVGGSERFHQVMIIGDRTCFDVDVDERDVPTFERETLDELLSTPYDGDIARIFDEYASRRDEILKRDIPAYLYGSAMFSSGADMRGICLNMMTEDGFIKLPQNMDRSAVGVWNYS